MDDQKRITQEYYGKEDLKVILTGLLEQEFFKEISEGRDNDEK